MGKPAGTMFERTGITCGSVPVTDLPAGSSLCQHAHFSISTSQRQPSQRQSQPSVRNSHFKTSSISNARYIIRIRSHQPSQCQSQRPFATASSTRLRHYPDQSQCQPSPYPSWLTATLASLALTPVQARLVRTSRYVLSCVSTPSHLDSQRPSQPQSVPA